MIDPSDFDKPVVGLWIVIVHVSVSQRAKPVQKYEKCSGTSLFHPVRLSYSTESAAIQQCFSLITNQRTVLSVTINQRNEYAV
jgi:hypothetical protein